ncbi:hypothetical protein B0T19DRAFT_106906 [Cercophora scortea]|uniref:Rhodopsin domain-containing protein n=1 Tax=Cercophora scortea TaxID=314031 RepID=A0AAE0MHN8_9PEZI|nr:hypothetical protein B0T19DRAFT_106906 [Cercophora scortea]
MYIPWRPQDITGYVTSRQEEVNFSGISHVGVPQHVFLGVIWTGVSISGLFLCGRLYSRFRGVRRLFVDDYLAVFAFALVATTGALWQWVGAPNMYYVLDVQSGVRPFVPDFFDRMRFWLTTTLVVEIFFETSLITVKLSLMFFFRRLDANINYLKWLWWPTFIFTLATYFISIGLIEYGCLVGWSTEKLLGYCNSPVGITFVDTTLKVNCTFDVFSEFLIMLQPIILLWNVRIRLAKKIAFIGLFSLSVVTMAAAIARTADTISTRRPDGQYDNTYLWLWSSIEPAVAIMVSCLSAFPALFRSSATRKGNNKPFSPSESYLRIKTRLRSCRKGVTGKSDLFLAELTTLAAGKDGDDGSSRADGSLSQLDNQQPVLVPAEKYGKPAIASCYYSRGAAGGDVEGRDEPGWVDTAARRLNRTITQQLEYKVTTKRLSNGV